MSVRSGAEPSQPAQGPDETARPDLELEKLRLDVEAARATRNLEADKLRLEIRHIKRTSSWWWHIMTLAPVFVGIATLSVGFMLNKTLNDAAQQQHDFENYTKLTEAFSKSGSAKLGAAIGLRTFLRPWGDRSDQTVELLNNELFKEHDPTIRRAIVQDLVYAGLPAFNRVRDVNIATREKLRKAAVQLLFHYADVDKAHLVPCPSCNVWLVSDDARNAASQYAPDLPDSIERTYGDWLSRLVYAELGDQGPIGVNDESRQPWQPAKRQLTAQAPAFLASVDVLRALLSQPNAELRNFNAAGIAVFDMYWRDADLRGINLKDSIVDGWANGADLSNADLTNANFRADLTRSKARTTSLCGAALLYAKLKLPSRAEFPNFSAANWWDIITGVTTPFTPRDKQDLEAVFPRKKNEPFAALRRDDRQSMCSTTRYTQGGLPAPDASFKPTLPVR